MSNGYGEMDTLVQQINSGAPAACHLEDCRDLATCVRVLMEFAWKAVNPPPVTETPIPTMSTAQAFAFADKLIGTELCTGAGEDESAQYLLSPIVRAFLEGAIGTEDVPTSHSMRRYPEKRLPLGRYLIAAGTAMVAGVKSP